MAGQALSPDLADAVLVIVGLLALLRGWRRGALVQLLSLGGLALGLLAGAWAAPRITAWAAPRITASPTGDGGRAALLSLGVLVVAMLVGQVIGARLGARLRRVAGRVGAGRVDQVLGTAVGLAATALVVWLLAAVLGQGPFPAVARQIEGSEIVGALDRTLPPAPAAVGDVAAVLGRDRVSFLLPGFGGGITAPPVPDTADPAVRSAAGAGRASTVRVGAAGCGPVLGFGSGFVVAPGFVVTNAHVVAGFDQLTVEDVAGRHSAEPILFDPALDVAVLAAPGLAAPALAWDDTAAEGGERGATLGFPGGRSELVVEPATVRSRLDSVGGTAPGTAPVRREALVLAAAVEHGDSGGPFVTADGRVAGVVFAGAADGSPTGYALTAEQVRPVATEAIARDDPVPTGTCRF